MGFDKEQFFEYIKNKTVSRDFVIKLYRLYKIYDLISKVSEKNGKDVIEKLEDSIYTVDNKVIEDKERISLELSNISDALKNVENDKLRNEISFELNKLKNEFEELDLSDKSVLLYFKKNISILQSSLGIKNTFLLAACEAFLELYRNINVKGLSNSGYKLIENSNHTHIVGKINNNESSVKDSSEKSMR